MARRDLLEVGTNDVLGYIEVTPSGRLHLHDGAQEVFKLLKSRLGDKAGKTLMDNGWSNGYLYLGPQK